MFLELKPLLSKRSLVLTASALDGNLIRLTVTPRPTDKDEAKALSVPFVVEGTAEALDSGLPAALVGYVAEHLTLDRALVSVKSAMEAGLQVAQDEARKRVADAKKTGGAKVFTKPSAEPRKEETKEAPKKPEPPPMLGLFGAPETDPATTDTTLPPEARPPSPQASAAPAAAAESDEGSNEEDEDEEDEPVTGRHQGREDNEYDEEQFLLREVSCDAA